MLTNQRTGDFAQLIDVLHGELIEALVGLFGARLCEDQCVQELVVILLEVFVRELRILSKDISCEVIVIVPRNGVSSPMIFPQLVANISLADVKSKNVL